MTIYSKKFPPLHFYIYAYLNDANNVYYIGKGSNKRAWNRHIKNGVDIRPVDTNRIIIMEANLTEIGAFALERRYIRWYGKLIDNTGVLINITNGGPSGSSCKGRIGRRGIPNKNPHPSKGKTYVEIFGEDISEIIKNKLKEFNNSDQGKLIRSKAGKKGWTKKGKWTKEEINKRVTTRRKNNNYSKDMSACHTTDAIKKRNITRKLNGVKYNTSCLQRSDIIWKREKTKILKLIQKIIEYYKEPFSYELLIRANKEKKSYLTEISVRKYISKEDILRLSYDEQLARS